MLAKITFLNFRSEADRKMAAKFVTCVRLFALSKNQENCTAIRIKEIITADYFRLDLFNKTADVDMCLPGEFMVDHSF